MKDNWRLPAAKSQLSLIERLLQNRGLIKSQQREFLNPPWPSFELARKHRLLAKKDLAAASRAVAKAIDEKRTIVIHGDYDVDGLVATAILWQTIHRDRNYPHCLPFIPNRFEHGYGLSLQSIDAILTDSKRGPLTRGPLAEKGLLITVDCGITATDEIKYAQEKGFEVLVIDHHARPQKVPSCLTIWSDQTCSGGLAWLLAQEMSPPSPRRYLDLAALAVVADLQPLLGFNRSLVKFGLECLNETENVGLRALIKAAGFEGRQIGTFEVGWILAPRLNAAGRLEAAIESLRLLCTIDEENALRLSNKLNDLNQERQAMTKASVERALKLVGDGPASANVSVVAHEEFHEGVIGLVAGKVVAKTGKPAVVISRGKEFSKASARSVNGFNIVEFLRSLGDHFENVGGHAGAAGFTIRTEKIEQFVAAVGETAAKLSLSPVNLNVDAELSLADLNSELLETLARFEPFGPGNPEPLFLSRDVRVADLRLVGNNGGHLKLRLAGSGVTWPAIGFGQGEASVTLRVGDRLDVLYHLSEDDWRGERRIQLKLKDFNQI